VVELNLYSGRGDGLMVVRLNWLQIIYELLDACASQTLIVRLGLPISALLFSTILYANNN
jgi:hypothetical protein